MSFKTLLAKFRRSVVAPNAVTTASFALAEESAAVATLSTLEQAVSRQRARTIDLTDRGIARISGAITDENTALTERESAIDAKIVDTRAAADQDIEELLNQIAAVEAWAEDLTASLNDDKTAENAVVQERVAAAQAAIAKLEATRAKLQSDQG